MVNTIKLSPIGFFSLRGSDGEVYAEGLACHRLPQLFDPPNAVDMVIIEVSHRRTFTEGWTLVDCYHVAWDDIEVIEHNGERFGTVADGARVIGVLRR